MNYTFEECFRMKLKVTGYISCVNLICFHTAKKERKRNFTYILNIYCNLPIRAT